MATELSLQALAELPVPLRHAFTEALTILDVGRIEALVAEISAIDAGLATAINLLVKNYNYQPILKALDALPPTDPRHIETKGTSG